jgi:hypothetical protein
MKRIFFVLMACLFLLGCNKKNDNENIGFIDINEVKVKEEMKIEEQIIEEVPVIIKKKIKSEADDITEYNYADGNGTILDKFIENDKKVTIRKHISRFQIWPSGEITAFAKPYADSDKLFNLKDRDYVNTLEVAYVIDLSDDSESSWVKIQDDNNRIGWLDMDDPRDPYRNGNGAFLEKIITKDKEWTIIKLVAGLSYWETLEVRDRPGITDSSVLFKLENESRKQFSVGFSAITKETDTIDTIKTIRTSDATVDVINTLTDHWLKIEDDAGRIGWIFGGYCSAERGGPKYNTPEEIVEFMFNLP